MKKQYQDRYITTRKACRQRAKLAMKREGLHGVNKRPVVPGPGGVPRRLPSYFAEHWREHTAPPKNRPVVRKG